MVTNMPPAMGGWSHTQPAHNMGWPDHQLQYPQQTMMQTYMQPVRTPSMPTHSIPRETAVPRPGQSTPWTTEEDNLLMDAKARGLAWDEIHKRYFPFKSGNACRKRHERVLAKARDTDWDEGRIQRVLNEYNRRREQIWRTLSDGVGERWEEVEKLMFQQGLRHLKTHRPRHRRNRSRASSGQAGLSEYDQLSEYDHTDDSGIGLGNAGHSRRASEIGAGFPQQSLPSVGPLLSETAGGYGYTSWPGKEEGSVRH